MSQRYFEDFAVGDRFETESHTLSEEEIVEFASRYDPQYLHVDPEAAQRLAPWGFVEVGGGRGLRRGHGDIVLSSTLSHTSRSTPPVDNQNHGSLATAG